MFPKGKCGYFPILSLGKVQCIEFRDGGAKSEQFGAYAGKEPAAGDKRGSSKSAGS